MKKHLILSIGLISLVIISCRKTTPAPDTTSENQEFVTPQNYDDEDDFNDNINEDTPKADPDSGYNDEEDTPVLDEEIPTDTDDSLDFEEIETKKSALEDIEFDNNDDE